MDKVVVIVARLVQLQRRVDEAREMTKTDGYRARGILLQVHQEIDSIIVEGEVFK